MKTYAKKQIPSRQTIPAKSRWSGIRNAEYRNDIRSILQPYRENEDQTSMNDHRAQEPTIGSSGSSKSKAYQGNIHRIAQRGVTGNFSAIPYLHQIQRSFGPSNDLSGVKAYTGRQAAAANQCIGSDAYTTGENIAFGVTPSLRTAAHEAAHVVQQRAGVQLSDGIGQPGDKYERHANQVADDVVAGRSAESYLDMYKNNENYQTIERFGSIQFWGKEHKDFTRKAIKTWNENNPKGTFMHIGEGIEDRMIKCSDDPDRTGRAYDRLIAGHIADERIYIDFILDTRKKRIEKYKKADKNEKKRMEDMANASRYPSEGPSHGEGKRPAYGSGGSEYNHKYMMSQINIANNFSKGHSDFITYLGAGQLGDAMHCAQDRGSHCEGNRYQGHDDIKDKLGLGDPHYDTDDTSLNTLGVKKASELSDQVLEEYAKLRSRHKDTMKDTMINALDKFSRGEWLPGYGPVIPKSRKY